MNWGGQITGLHCCACSRVCAHVGGPYYCAQHGGGQTTYPNTIPNTVPFTPAMPQSTPIFAPSISLSPAWMQIRKLENGYVVIHGGKEFTFRTLREIAEHFEPEQESKEEG